MAKKERFDSLDGTRTGQDSHAGYVPVLMATSIREAEEYCQLFSDHDIDAVIGDEELAEADIDCKLPGRGMIGALPVLVAEEMLEEAREIIADRENVAGFGLGGEDDFDDAEQDDDDLGLVETLDSGLDEDNDLLYDVREDEPKDDEP